MVRIVGTGLRTIKKLKRDEDFNRAEQIHLRPALKFNLVVAHARISSKVFVRLQKVLSERLICLTCG